MAPIPDDVTFDPLATGAVTAASGPAAPVAVPSTLSFAPGSIVAGRYRLVAMLGRGGMGDVYRADDLTLDQAVALKFLPAGITADDDRLSRFHNELRVARQVSHRNVCRVYDLGEVNGRRFLTMEYVDGEDLASLLRRIGRVPQDKALDLARQLCAGVAAAHDRGVLHCDLKPANIMIDGQGNVRITDFGIATVIDAAERGFAGTPQYMAPEQFEGRPASIRTDIYSLGLVLFELLTGRRAIESRTLQDLQDFHRTGTIATPSSIVRDLDPAVERIILRCLERDPERRPASALVVAAALPGADPLAAALAAGETPSPELVAAAGEADALSPRLAIAAAAIAVAGVLVFAGLSARTSLPGRVPLPEPPEVLVDRAESIVAALGHDARYADRAFDFFLDDQYIQWILRQRRGPDRWDALGGARPPVVRFWYRTSPGPMRPTERRVSREDPPATFTGSQTLVLDPEGRLVAFRAVPPQEDPGEDRAAPADWVPLFAAAGFSPDAFTSVAPQWLPRDYADERAAWEGPSGGTIDVPIRIEAAAYRGKPVWFEVVGPWTQATRMSGRAIPLADFILQGVVVVAAVALVAFAGLLARQNVRANRADRRGAARLAAYVLIAGCAVWAIGSHHTLDLGALLAGFFRHGGQAALFAGIVWIVYVAVEPYVRRVAPDTLLGWSRLLAGHVRDPRVGRDTFIGLTVGIALALGDLARTVALPWLGYPAPRPPYALQPDLLSGGLLQAARWLDASTAETMEAMFTVLLLVVLRLLLRRNWLFWSVTAFVLALMSTRYMGSTTNWIMLFPLAAGALLTFVVVRYGLLSLVVARFVWGILVATPMTLEMNHWSATASNATIALLVGLALFAFYASRAGQPLLGAVLRD